MFTKDDVLAVARVVVEREPDRTNDGECRYTTDGDIDTPHCIAAVILDELYLFDPMTIMHVGSVAAEPDYFRELGLSDGALHALDTLQLFADGDNAEGSCRWEDAYRLGVECNFESPRI